MKGERVSFEIFFRRFRAGEFNATGKMVLPKQPAAKIFSNMTAEKGELPLSLISRDW